MASHVVVIDNSFRRYQIKTTPAKHLTDVLQEACAKFGVDASQYTLKQNDKQIDLSRTIRLSGLQPGAKLSLVQASRSPSVVNVALQLPPSGDSSGSLGRLTEKFPSNTPVWQILRRFESGVAGGSTTAGQNLNITQRATAQMANGTSVTGAGAGRLYYEMPVVNVMGRELASFADLQKTLGQLGYNSGSALLRLQYKNTQQPLEEAMTEITQYFQEIEQPASGSGSASGAHAGGPSQMQSVPDSTNAALPDDTARAPSPPEPMDTDTAPTASEAAGGAISTAPADDTIIASSSVTDTSTDRPISHSSPPPGLSIFAAPTSSTPQAASISSHNESDYVPTVDHAKLHQARLEKESRNRRLPSDKELADQQRARQQALAEVSSVNVRLRFPDQSSAQQSFGKDATARDLYDLCRRLMSRPNGETFQVRVAGPRGAAVPLDEDGSRLIKDLGWKGGVLATVVWGDDVSIAARRAPALKEEYRAQARELKVEEPAQRDEEDKGQAVDVGRKQERKDKDGGGGDKEAKLKKLFMGKFGKK